MQKNETCPRCVTPLLTPAASHCPHCGLRFSDGIGPGNFLQSYLSTLWKVLTRTEEFFSSVPRSQGLSIPLAFALLTHWIGTALQFLWVILIGPSMAKLMTPWLRVATDVFQQNTDPARTAQLMEMRERVTHWFLGAGSILLDPFLTLFSILVTSLLVFVGARLLVPSRNGVAVTYETAVRVICFGLAPSILAGLPLLGGVIASLCVLIVTVIGARAVYQVGTGRALAIALFPKLAVFLLFFGGLIVALLAVFKMLASVF